MRSMNLYTKMEQLEIEIEEVDIRLCVYVFKNTNELMQYLKNNHYIAYIEKNGHFTENDLLEKEHLEFTYDEIDTVEYVSNCTEENAFSVGTIASAGFNFSIFEEKYSDDGDISYYDYDFTQAMVIPVFTFYYNDEQLDTLQLGVFYVDSYVKEDEMIKFTCLDNAKYLDKKIKQYITGAIELPNSMDYVISGIITSACNLSMVVKGTEVDIEYPTITNLTNVKTMIARTILSYMLELIGAFGYFNSSGAFSYKTFRASQETSVTIPLDRVMEYTREGYSAIMNGARLSYGDDVEVESFSWSPEYIPADIDGDGVDEDTESAIPLTEENPILKDKKTEECQTILHNLLNRMSNFNFKPGTVGIFLPDFRIEIGDFVAVEDKLQYTRKFLASQITYKDNLEMELVSAWDGETYNIKNDGSIFIGKSELITSNMPWDTYYYLNRLLSENGLQGTFDENIGLIDCNIKEIICKNSSELITNPIEDGYPYVKICDYQDEPPVYAYLDGSTIVIYSDADILKLVQAINMFQNYAKAEKIELSMMDTSTVSSMGRMFANTAYNSENISIVWGEHFDTRNATDMSYMFQNFGCNVRELTLNLSHFNTSKVYNMSYMFNGIGANSDSFELDISNFDVTTVLNMTNMFRETAINAQNVMLNIDKFYTLNATYMNSMFEKCNLKIIEKIVGNSEFTTINVENMSRMFKDIAENSENVLLDLSRLDTSRVSDMSSMFENAGHNATNFIIKLGEKFDISNAYTEKMFYNHGIAKILCPTRGIPLMLREVYDGVIETY